MAAYKITVTKKMSLGGVQVEPGMNVEVFCKNGAGDSRSGELLSDAFEEKYGFRIRSVESKSIKVSWENGYGWFDLDEL